MNVYTDLRAIVLEKSTQREDMSMSCPPGRWLMLGHMDWLRVERIGSLGGSSNSVCLDQLREHRRDLSIKQSETSAYSQSLYVLRDFPVGQRTRVENFWNRPATFMAITRIHSNGQRQALFEKEINEKLCGAEQEGFGSVFPYDACPDTSQDGRLGKRVIYLHYRSLELSDVILVTKSDSVEGLLSCIGRLFTLETAGDIYSYYCISVIESERAASDDCIPLISARFAVRSSVACHSQIGRLQKIFSKPDGCPPPAFFVTGTEDINIIAYDTTSRQLRDIFLQILSMDDGFRQAFYDSTTRLGIRESSLCFASARTGESGSWQDPALVRSCGKLLESFMELYKKNPLINDWSRPLMELLNMLYHMSRNCVLWEMCYTLLNGLRGMICCVEEQVRRGGIDKKRKIKSCR